MSFMTPEFRCVALGPGDIDTFFKVKRQCYEDDNPEHTGEEKKIALSAMERQGMAFVSSIFNNPDHQAFVIFSKDGQIAGSAELLIDEANGVATFCKGYIASAFRRQKLSRLIYRSRERFVRAQTSCRTLRLMVKPHNSASQAAARRNGFRSIGFNESGRFVFEKAL